MIKPMYPWILDYTYIVLAVFISLFIYIAIRRRRVLKTVKAKDSILWYIVQIVKIVALILLFIALSVPVEIHTTYKEVQGLIEKNKVSSLVKNMTALHVLIVDESKSMLYTDGTNITRFTHALKFINNYLNALSKSDKVMIIGFAEYPRKICVGNITYCRSMLYKLEPGKKYSSISAAIGYAYTYVSASQYPAVFVIISDGAYNAGGDPYETIYQVNQSGYPVLFVRVGLDRRANKLETELESSNILVINVNQFTEKLVKQLAKNAARELRVEAFIAKKLLEIKVLYHDINPYPTVSLLLGGLILFTISRIEGY